MKVGWQSIAGEHTNMELTFFAAGGSELEALVVSEGRLFASSTRVRKMFKHSSQGKAFVGPRYHRYIVCGLGLEIMKVLTLFREMVVDKPSRPDSDQLVLEAFCELNRGTLALKTISKLREITEREVVVIATPFPCTKSLLALPDFSSIGIDDTVRCASLFAESCRRVLAVAGARFLPQPQETVASNQISTLDTFCSNAERLARGPDDNVHKNAAYGTIVLKAVLSF